MACKAVINSSYRVRLGLLGGMTAFFFAYCMYDGFFAYPKERLIARTYAQFKAEDRLAQWPQYALERGWPDGTDGEPGEDHSDWNIYTQYIMGALVFPFALVFGVSFFKAPGRWISLDDQGFTTSWGQKVGFDRVASLDLSRWRTKGIAVVLCQDQGRRRKLVLDNFKYSPDEIATMVDQVGSYLKPAQDTATESNHG